jgi:pantothenate kinase
MTTGETSLERLAARVEALLARGGRRILGVTGAPGSGKSTLAQEIVARMPERAALVPMDGFHLANSELARLGRRARKGAEDTFDSAGYVALLRRLREQRPDEIEYAPEFRREVDESIGSAIPIFPAVPLIVTEGNYLLLDIGNWSGVRPLLDEVWYVDLDSSERRERLVARHRSFGRSESAARDWAAFTDEPNAVLIAANSSRADVIVRLPAAFGAVSPGSASPPADPGG